MGFFSLASGYSTMAAAESAAMADCAKTSGRNKRALIGSSFCGIDKCISFAFSIYQGDVRFVTPTPQVLSTSMSQALAGCAKQVCALHPVGCASGAPVCYIAGAVCGGYGLAYSFIDRYTYFNASAPNEYFYSDRTRVRGTLANLNGDIADRTQCRISADRCDHVVQRSVKLQTNELPRDSYPTSGHPRHPNGAMLAEIMPADGAVNAERVHRRDGVDTTSPPDPSTATATAPSAPSPAQTSTDVGAAQSIPGAHVRSTLCLQ